MKRLRELRPIVDRFPEGIVTTVREGRKFGTWYLRGRPARLFSEPATYKRRRDARTDGLALRARALREREQQL